MPNDTPQSPATRPNSGNGNDALIVMLDKWATDPAVDPDKIKAFWEIRREYKAELRAEAAELSRRAFETDMAEVQGRIDNIKRGGKNPVFTSAYARLEDLDAAARPVYTTFGFNIRYSSMLSDRSVPLPPTGWMRVVLIINHKAGHTEEHHLDGPHDRPGGSRGPTRSPIQEVGSTDTYLRRYLLQRTLNLVPHDAPWDDDGRQWGQQRPAEGQQGPPPSQQAAAAAKPVAAPQKAGNGNGKATIETWVDQTWRWIERAATETLAVNIVLDRLKTWKVEQIEKLVAAQEWTDRCEGDAFRGPAIQAAITKLLAERSRAETLSAAPDEAAPSPPTEEAAP